MYIYFTKIHNNRLQCILSTYPLDLDLILLTVLKAIQILVVIVLRRRRIFDLGRFGRSGN